MSNNYRTPRTPLTDLLGPLLSSLSNNSNIDLRMINYNNMHRLDENFVLQESLQQEPTTKQVISEQGKKQLKQHIFSEKDTIKECPILLRKFNIGDELTCLPCNHIFDTEAITQWVSNNNAACPVCRFKLDSTIVPNTPSNRENIHSNPILNPTTTIHNNRHNNRHNNIHNNMHNNIHDNRHNSNNLHTIPHSENPMMSLLNLVANGSNHQHYTYNNQTMNNTTNSVSSVELFDSLFDNVFNDMLNVNNNRETSSSTPSVFVYTYTTRF
tara:strand:- start:785 stop:1591 length:807 start_codon:yes stop_codon:yes gene_type:complete